MNRRMVRTNWAPGDVISSGCLSKQIHMSRPNNNWNVTLSRDGSEKPATLATFRAKPPMQYAGQPAHQQLLEHNRAIRRRSDRLRATAAYPRGCMAAAEREPREAARTRPNGFA